MTDLDLTDLKRRLSVHTNSARRIQAEPMFPIRADAVWELIAAAKERDELRTRIAELEAALQGLHDDCAEYGRVNNIGGFNNHWMKAARAALDSKLGDNGE